MWLPRVVTTAPASEPVTLAEAKAHCRVDDTASDDLLGALIVTARQHVEQYAGLAIEAQTVSLQCSDWSDLGALPVAPVSAVTSLKYLDQTATEQTVDSGDYVLIGADTLAPSIGRGFGVSWPTPYGRGDAIRLVVVAGYADVPAPIKAAMLLLIGHWFENREAVVEGQAMELPLSVSALLANYRVFA
jgi:uncharacterized phiE125 gp8 family phage protein